MVLRANPDAGRAPVGCRSGAGIGIRSKYPEYVYKNFSQNQKGFGCIVAAVISLSFVIS